MKVKKYSVKPAALAIVGCIVLLSLRAVAQGVSSEVSVQGAGFFTEDSNGNGIQNNRHFDLGLKPWVRPYLVGPRTGNEDTTRSTRFWRDSGLSFERAAVGSWIAVGAAEEVVAT